ncbi:MAG TPA: response regulator transcription factor [Pseudonocardia sp.]|jgi:DNA-binding NarL/FixJ family response regulator|uniref:response regulator transcription factor n=1 Tax=Pseudonocardia sp. TaxID=60912 RepID=UPI002C496795|nr:response regulator transcription factor [Pseudonocardia sp.]HTF46714.1 response regulator transcription factor [Pseudonocardia sp.]
MTGTAGAARGAEGDSIEGYSVIIVDDHELFSTSLRMALRVHGLDAHQVPPGNGVEDILARARKRRVGLAVLDMDLGLVGDGGWLSGVDLVGALRQDGWKVLVVSGRVDRPWVAAAIAAGAIGSVPKSRSFECLLETVLAAASGQPVMADAERDGLLAQHRDVEARERELARKLDRLSTREREILELLAAGHRAGEIADRSVVSLSTVRTQIRAILAKLQVNSQIEAAAMVRQSPW